MVGTITPEGGDLNLGASFQDDNHSKLDPDGDRSGEEGLDLFGACAGRHIVIVGSQAEEVVADTAAGIECLESLGTQSLHDRSCRGFTHTRIVPCSHVFRQAGGRVNLELKNSVRGYRKKGTKNEE